jgi:hypothetical protein
MVYAGPNTAYMRLLRPWLEKKKRLALDKWGRDDQYVAHVHQPLIDHLRAEVPEKYLAKRYPPTWRLEDHVNRVVRDMLVSDMLTGEFASYFEGKSLEELDELAASFKLGNCQTRDELNTILRNDAAVPTAAGH